MEYDIYISASAQDDIENIYDYITYELMAQNSAEKLVNIIYKSIKSIYVMPNRHKSVDIECLKGINIRSFTIKNYKIYYYVDETNLIVFILRITSTKTNSDDYLSSLVEGRDDNHEQ